MWSTIKACLSLTAIRPYSSGPVERSLSIPANSHYLSVTAQHESATIDSGATDASRPAGFIRACWLLRDGLRIAVQQGSQCHGRSDGPVSARMSLRHIRGTKYLRAAAQRAGTFRQKRESNEGDSRIHPTVCLPRPFWIPVCSGMTD
jgi:hypothetical protein